MSPPPCGNSDTQHPHPYRHPVSAASQRGFTLLTALGFLTVVTVGLAMLTPMMIRERDRHQQEVEHHHLQEIGNGIVTFVRHHQAFPPNLAALSPDFVPFSASQLARNHNGFLRYLAFHPGLAGFQNSTGLQASNLVNARFLVISDLSQEAAVTIATSSDFETWWTTNEAGTPNLQIYRGNLASHFAALTILPQGNGGSFSIYGQPTPSNGSLLPTLAQYHLIGTEIGLDEANIYSTPEIHFGLTSNVSYWFDPTCSVSKRWNPVHVSCGP